LGLRLPLLWTIAEARHAFHNHRLGRTIRNGYHALALHETRAVYSPVMWEDRDDFPGHVEQVWFRGTHGDVGGQLSGFEAAKPLANFSLVWMLEKAAHHNMPLPDNWRARFFTDIKAPSTGTWRGWAKIFVIRHHRSVGRYMSESLHPSAQNEHAGLSGTLPVANLNSS
ncbi:MAG: phospholipase effector Tle1 domain-containing protein, partial [Paracoccaceae bacterium]